MYEELVKALREHSKRDNCNCDTCFAYDAEMRGYTTCSEELTEKAADAIENVSKAYRMMADKREVNMAEYHVGCGAFAIYAGTLNSRNKNLWQNKSDVTDEAVSAVAQYLLQENKVMRFEYRGKKYELCVVEVDE